MVATMLPLAVMPVGAAAVADLTVTIDTGASVTLKDADGDGYYDIGTANDLYAFAAAVNGGNSEINGELTADITVNKNVLTADGALNGNGSDFRVWTPIGGNSYTYNGTFDGGEHTVSGLYFNNSTVNSVGMFGNIYNGGKVMNVGVIDSYICGSGYVGGVAGVINDGTVENSYNTGTVTGRTDVGGMVGKLDGTITNSYNAGTVTGTSSNVGGVVGSNYNIVTNSYNTGSVSSNGSYVGGVVGYNYNIVTNSYNTGTVSGSAHVGGVVGSNNYYAKNVENCYNIGTVSGTDNFIGGVAGGNFSTVTNCYYLNGCATGANNVKQFGIGNGNTGSTTADVSGSTTGKNSLDFGNGTVCELVGYHSIDENCVCTNCGVVEHNNFDIKGFCTECDAYEPAELNENGYYEIGNAGQLFWFANYINTVDRTANAVLTADIDLEGRRWTPIGSTGENNNNFRGVFDGQNHTIEGLYVEGGRAGLGFFGEVRTGTVKNFTIYGEVVANTEVDYIGGVIGSICGLNGENDLARNGAVIQNITSYVNLTAKKHGIGMIGGFVGYANHESLIENCSWYGTFDAGIYRVDSGAGGFIGKIQENTSEVTIRNCGAYGTIKTNYAGDYNNTATIYMGGFLSFTNTNAKTTLENCLFAGKFERGANLTDQALLGAFGTVRSVNAIKNCYYLGDDGLEAVHSDSPLKPGSDNVEITKVTVEQLKSGEVAYKLQGTQNDHFWGQTIGTDNYPILGGEKVYHGYTSCADEVMVYSNDSSVSAANPVHVWGEGVLTRPTKTQEGYYTYTCTACGEATKTEEVERAANYADYTKALEDLRAYLDSDMLTDENKSYISEWLATYDTDEAYGFIAGEEATVQEYIDATAYYASEFEAAIADCLAGNHSGNGDYCEVCGAYIHSCDFSGEWKYDADKHWKECSCGLKNEEGTHTGGTATCTTQAVCTTCGAQYGEFSKTNHTFDNTCCGYCGAEGNEQSVWWTLVDGTLTIGGTGAMADYDYKELPWYNSTKSVTALVIQEGVTHIGDHSFMTCKMESVYIPASVKTIGAYAFKNCFNLKDVTFADGSQVTELGDGSFQSAAFEQITIPASVTSIGFGALDVIFSLTDIFIEEGNTSYKDIDGVLYTTDGTLLLYPINKAGTEFTTPDGVTKIAKFAFGDNKNLRTVTLSEGVTTIEDYVFFYCESLQTLTIPASVTSIGFGAFEMSSQLTDIFVDEDNTSYKDIDGVLYTTDGTLVYYPVNKAATEFTTPEGVTKIAAYAFFCNKNLVTITLSEGVTTIEESAFENCDNLQTLTIPASITAIAKGTLDWYYQTVTVNLPCNWDGSLYTFYEGCATLNYSDHVADETAGQTCKGYKCTVCGAFYGEVAADAHDWSNKDGICANGCGAECTHENQTGSVCEICGISLHTCDFTGEWKHDADKHWKECECGLLSEEGAHEYMEFYPICQICNYFEGTEIAVGETISIDNEEIIKFAPEVSGTYILSSFGGGCNPHVNLYDGEMFPLESADNYGDSKNFRLEYEFTEGEVYYFEFVDSEFRFGYQIKLECETHAGSTQTCGGYKCDVCGELFGEGIGEHTGGTQNCSGYKCEVCGKYYGESIGEHVGGEATCAKKAVCDVCGEEYGELDKDNHTFDGVTCGYYGVTGDEQSVWWIFEDGILTIGGTGAMKDKDDYSIPWYYFRDEITAVVISDGVTRIGINAFAECNISGVAIPASVETIGYNAFGRCTSLENVTFAEGSQLTAIEESAFYFCYALQQITLPEKVNNIHPSAFYYSDVYNFIVDENNTTYKAIEGLLCSTDGTLVIYPSGRTSNTFTTPEGVTAIGERSFENCTSLNYIILSEGIKTIEEGAFVGSGLETVTISSTVTSISENAFSYCYNLNTVNAPCNWDGSLYTFEEGVTINISDHADKNSDNLCDGCGISLHTCDFTGEWKYDADKHWKECTADDCDKISEEADHDFLNGECTVCDYVCDHANATSDLIRPVQNADGTWGQGSIVTTCPDCGNVETESVDRADYTAFDAAVAKLQEILASGNLIDGPKATITTNLNSVINGVGYNKAAVEQTSVNDGAQRINGYIAMLEAGLADGTMKKADLSYMTALLDEVNALIDSNPNNIVSSEIGNYSGPYSYYRGQINNGNLTQPEHDRNMVTYGYETQLETLLAGLKDGTALRADYTEIDEVIAAIDEALKTASVTEDMQAELDSIKKELDAYKANTNVSVAMLANSGLLAKAEAIAETMNNCANGVHVFTKYEVVVEPACEVAGKEVAVCDNGCGATDEKAVEALGHTELPAVKENEIAATCENAGSYDLVVYCDVCKAEVSRTTETVEALGHTELPAVKENEVAADCENAGSYDLVVYCDVCKAEVSRTTETVEALGHAFTVYTVTAEPTCEEAGKQVSVCDNGCGATDEQSVAALGHTEETVKGYAATCTATGLTDGVKCSVCDKILTAQQTIAQTAHKDDNGDYKCDYGCGHEFEKPADPEQPDTPDTPDEPTDDTCDHICHSNNALMKILWKIICFFYRLFNIQQYCDCGVIHYDAPVFG